MRKPITKKQREVIYRHIADPFQFRQVDVMKELGLGKDYHAFTSLFYRVTMSNK